MASLDRAQLRQRGIGIYKQLLRLAPDYPDPSYQFALRVRTSFRKNSDLKDLEEIKKKLDLAEHVRKETLALISLAKYRHLRRTYPPQD
ncbi:hypothetical protein BDY24DRAFT_376819 [Mrakia frigida]|uniref:uncharacterized protein n=1 Tax=Mrakia frigida TaxID=29902 RepID=UPI003FCC0F28